jgi:tetratricopeptide (TPR) repeat protein
MEAWATRAQVKDYRSDWYTTVLAASLVAEIHEAISLASDAGRYMGAYVPPGVASPNTGAGSDPAGIYAEWILHRDPRVAQDMAWRAAESALRQGQPERALEFIARGRARSNANTPFYAHLLELEGDIRKRQGDLQGALEAWKAAALLNDARSG